MAVAKQQITIVDLNDAKSLILFLGSNNPYTQIFNRENSSYVPNYTVSPNLVITPELYISGSSANQISHIKTTPVWKINGSTNLVDFGATAGTSSPYALTIVNNLTAVSQLKIECEVIYVDPVTLVETTAKSVITITKTENSGQLIIAIAYAPTGNVFKQGTTSLKAHCDLWRGSAIDATNVTYQWYKLVSGSWVALDATTNYGCAGYTSNELTIPSTAVLNYEVFKCVITDTDSSSGTYNTTVSDTITFADMTDPYQVQLVSPAGDKLVNGSGELVISAEVWQNGEKIADATAEGMFTYTWRKYDKDGVQDTEWGTAGVKTGRQLTVTATDVSIKSTFVVEIALS